MKRTLALTLIAASLSVLAAPAFADGIPHYPKLMGTSYASTGSQASAVSRSQVRAQLVQSEQNGSLAQLDRTTYIGH